MKKKYHHVKYYSGDAYAYNKKGEITGTISPRGIFKPIGRRRIPPGEKRGG